MKIQFITSVAGERFAYRNRQQVELPDAIAQRFVKAGQAVEIKAPARARRRGAAMIEAAINAFTPEQRG